MALQKDCPNLSSHQQGIKCPFLSPLQALNINTLLIFANMIGKKTVLLCYINVSLVIRKADNYFSYLISPVIFSTPVCLYTSDYIIHLLIKIRLRKFPYAVCQVLFFFVKGYWILSNVFSEPVEMIIWGFPSFY